MADQKRVHLLISGQVQGVGFRAATEQMAHNAGVRGWVRNRTDGRVEAVFEGATPVVESMVRWCHQGPPAAQVEKVERWEEPVEGVLSFQVKSTAF
ncbi:MAG: acylphosphatase [Synechococcaceae cyanobacterium SM2_3_1]|nr:acylphosphatase [Synechococcaceae cyanobacterium SM2_3_1]